MELLKPKIDIVTFPVKYWNHYWYWGRILSIIEVHTIIDKKKMALLKKILMLFKQAGSIEMDFGISKNGLEILREMPLLK